MAGPVSEKGFVFDVVQLGGSYTTPGHTVSLDFNMLPASLVVHVGLARVAAAEAAIGIVEFFDEHAQPVNLGTQENWATALYGRHGSFNIGAFVARGVMKGWAFIQVWE